jgi:hypothetical protein
MIPASSHEYLGFALQSAEFLRMYNPAPIALEPQSRFIIRLIRDPPKTPVMRHRAGCEQSIELPGAVC